MSDDDVVSDLADTGPRSITIDGQTIDEFSLAERIALDKYKRATRARRVVGGGVVFSKIIPHGAMLDSEGRT